MRNGTAGKEMQLPPQALRALSEARVSMDERVSSKQGRKGSITMGLFKESRAQSKQRPGSDRNRVPSGMLSPTGAVEEVISEEEDERSGVDDVPSVEERLVSRHRDKVQMGTSVSAREDETRSHGWPSRQDTNIPPGDVKTRAPLNREDTFRVSSPAKMDRRPTADLEHAEVDADSTDETPRIDTAQRPSYISRLQEDVRGREMHNHDSGHSTHSMSFDSESGWTTTSEESEESSLSSLGPDASVTRRRRLQSRSQSDVHDSQAYEGDSPTDRSEEEEPMTVPLQPFGHAVGGHSSIYQFTRRAVCKVSAIAKNDI
jgi:hypothetical protein